MRGSSPHSCSLSLLVPNLWAVLHAAPKRASLWHAVIWGCLWGIGGLTFGLSIRYLGIALGYAIALGFCTVVRHPDAAHLQRPDHCYSLAKLWGQIILAGVAVCMSLALLERLSGLSKEKELTAEEKAAPVERDYSFGEGLAVAIFAGIMSSCFAYGLAAASKSL